MEDFYLVCNGRIVHKDEELDDTKIYHVCYRLPGGKGGFGSMLRTIGAQIEKTTNKEAMRDLSGRRMRDINNEKKLADWVAGAADREREQEEKRKERRERRRAEAEGKMHKFRDKKYMEQKDVVANNLDDALTQGLKRSAAKQSSAPLQKKVKKSTPAATSWAGMDLNDLSSSDEESEESSGSLEKTELEQIRESVPVVAELTAEEGDKTTVEESTTVEPPSDVNQRTEANEKDSTAHQEKEGTTAEPPSDVNQRTEANEKDSTAHQEKEENTENKVAEPESNGTDSNNTDPIDLNSHQSAAELEGYGLGRLKHELTRRGLKCGGSLVQRAVRLYSVKGLSNDQIDSALFAKKK